MPNGSVEFRVWAPRAASIEVKVVGNRPLIPMRSHEHGYYTALVSDISPHAMYYYVIDGKKERPDPASRAQPQGVHGPSMVVEPSSFSWSDGAWTGRTLQDFILYELHIGTFTKTGTFDAVIPYLRYLKDEVGITAIEIMPVAEFPGRRNWGYDGTFLFAPQSSYGGPDGLKLWSTRVMKSASRSSWMLSTTISVPKETIWLTSGRTLQIGTKRPGARSQL